MALLRGSTIQGPPRASTDSKIGSEEDRRVDMAVLRVDMVVLREGMVGHLRGMVDLVSVKSLPLSHQDRRNLPTMTASG